MSSNKLKAHVFCALFPKMPADEFRGLKESIKKNGLLNPVVTYKGEILDGAHRYRACQQLKVEPLLREFDGDDAFGFVFDQNIKRRQLSPSQRAVIAAGLANIKNGGKKNGKTENGLPSVTLAEASKLLNVSVRNVSNVKRIMKVDSTLVPMISDGEMTVTAALEEVEKMEVKAQLVSRLHDVGQSDLASKVECGIKSVAQGVKVLESIEEAQAVEAAKNVEPVEEGEGFYTDEVEDAEAGLAVEEEEYSEEEEEVDDTRTDVEKEREFLLKRLKDARAALDDVYAHYNGVGLPDKKKTVQEAARLIEELIHWES